MKKVSVVLIATIFVIGCSKKSTPSATNNNGNVPNEKVVVAEANNNNGSGSNATAKIDAASQSARTDAKTSTTKSPEQLGQATYSTKCGNCHGLKVTTDYTASRWATVMQVMAIKANLTEEEKQNVLAYVNANAKKG
jgi:nitrate/TMAO reductase-like tetraheme cytochrome c subunit